jgi:outer membrane receptor protein involved in Fe transport
MMAKACAFVVALLIVAIARPLLAQSTTGSISGTVTDESKAVLPGVTIAVTHTETNIARALVSDERGRYRALNLAPGTYQVAADLQGFSPILRRDIVVTIGSDVPVDVVMKVGTIAEQLTVTGEAAQVDLSSSVVGGVVTTTQIAELPLNGRSFMQLAAMQPGVIISRGTGQEFSGGFGNTQISVAGARPEHTGYLLEGTNISDVSDKAPSSMAGVLLGVDTVQEFSVQTHGYSAEFGRAAGGIVSAVTKSGTNSLRGTLFEFLRNSAMDAKNFFDEGDDPPPFRRNQFGGTVGGPVVKNKLFFFGSYEGLRQRLSTTQIARMPNQLAHQGFLPDGRGGVINVGVHQLVRPYLDLLFPIPTGRDYGDGTAELRHAPKSPTDEDFYVGKVDWQAGAKDSFSMRISSDRSDTQTVLEHPLFQQTTGTDTRYFTVQNQHLFSSKLLNQVKVAINRTGRTDDIAPLVKIPNELYFTKDTHPLTGGPYWGVINIAGVSSAGVTNTMPVQYMQNVYQASDTLTWNKGRQTWKFGFDWQRYHFDGFSYSRYGGEFRFRNLQEFLTLRRSATAAADRFTGNLPGTDTKRNMRQNYFAVFGQNDYEVGDRLTLNLGLRYEFITTPYELQGRVAGLRSLNDLESGPQGVTPGLPLFDNPSLKSFAPRVGFAWRPTSSGKTLVRGGYGLFYQPLTVSFYRGTTFRIYPYFAGVDIRQPTVFGPAMQQVLDRGIAPGLVQRRSEFIYWDANQPYTQHFHVSLQKELPGALVVEIGYLGSRGKNLPFYGDPNSVPAERLPDGTKRVIPGATIRYPSWGRIRTRINIAESFYDGFIASVNRRFSNGLLFQGSYTHGHSIDDWSGGLQGGTDFDNGAGSATDWWDPRAERGRSNFDVRHTFVFNAVYEVPWGKGLTGVAGVLGRGWQVGGIVNMASGIPFTVYSGFDRAGDRQSDATLQKPNLAAGASNNPIVGSPDQWFDPTAFELPPAGYYGNLGRNTLTGPTLKIVDLSLFKNTRVGPSLLQFRIEVFNVFNRANFATPSVEGASLLFNPNGSRRSGVGQITRTVTSSRQVQLGLKLLF